MAYSADSLTDNVRQSNSRKRSATPSSGTAWLLAGLMAATGAIHLAMAPVHAGSSLIDPIGFAVAGWFGLGVAGVIIAGRATTRTWAVALAGNLVLIGLWGWSRTVGLPVGGHASSAEAVGGVDLVTVALEVAAVMVATALLVAPRSLRLGAPVAAIGALAVLGVATAVVVSPESASHGHDGAGGHGHDGGDHFAEMAAIDASRCDLDFNPAAYYTETAILGIDTYGGGAMAGGHDDHGSLTDAVAVVDPLGGRGSKHLDTLVSLSSQADSESAAGRVIEQLGYATEDEYQAWLQWLAPQVGGDHDHDPSAPDDNDGHGAHLGPQAWLAMVDADQCAQLAEELEVAREVALSYPTAQDALDAGYFKVTTYVPGIASHYMNFRYVDGEFSITEPEMLLYDGEGPDASIVGLSYYVLLQGDAEPTQGFTGPNDHYHRHVGLCIRGGLVVGDTTTTAEECAERGGVKALGGSGWMSHAWVVPGCESPWGVFSGANPMLDGALGEASGTDGGGCAGSGVRQRYDLTPGRPGSIPAAGGAAEQAAGR